MFWHIFAKKNHGTLQNFLALIMQVMIIMSSYAKETQKLYL